MNKGNWKNIHEDFAKKGECWNESYQQLWEKNLTYQEAQEWVAVGFNPEERFGNTFYECLPFCWKSLGLTPQQTKSWRDIGLGKRDYEFAAYLRGKTYQPNKDLNLKSIRQSFNTWLTTSKTAQEYLNTIYPKEKRKEVKTLYISNKKLSEKLDLSDFVNLEKLYCSKNQLSSLDLSNCSKLEEIDCDHNLLTSLDLSDYSNLISLDFHGNHLANFVLPKDCSKLKRLDLTFNKFNQDLSFLKEAVNLEKLYLSNNKFYGSLKHLKEMNKLKTLHIDDTDIDSGLSYLSESVEHFDCVALMEGSKCSSIVKLLADRQRLNFSLKPQDFKSETLHRYLRENQGLDFITRLNKLLYIAQEIKDTHEKGLPKNFNLGLIYSAPEILRSKSYTQKADIYSFGIMAYEVLSNAYPYYECAHDPVLLPIRICEGLRPNMDKLSIPPSLKDLIEQCWDADPEKRPSIEKLSDKISVYNDDYKAPPGAGEIVMIDTDWVLKKLRQLEAGEVTLQELEEEEAKAKIEIPPK